MLTQDLDKIIIIYISVHTKCFICPICQAKCFVGSCARDQGVESRYGVYWYCGEHMLLPPGQKTSKLQELNMGKGHKKANGPAAGAQDVKKAEKTKELQAKLKEAEEQRKKYEQLCKDLEAQLKAL